jgi:hypothetical protein
MHAAEIRECRGAVLRRNGRNGSTVLGVLPGGRT